MGFVVKLACPECFELIEYHGQEFYDYGPDLRGQPMIEELYVYQCYNGHKNTWAEKIERPDDEREKV